MPGRSLRRLAGCIVIELLLALNGAPADFEYRAGTGEAEHAKAIAIEDRRGTRVVLVDADFAITRKTADLASVILSKAYGLDRPQLLFRGMGGGPAHPQDLVNAATEALAHRERAQIRRTPAGLTIVTSRCLATLFPIALENCAEGTEVHGTIRAAFQMVEPPHGLLRRDQPIPAYPVQAISLGKGAVLLAVGGGEAVELPGVMVVTHANDDRPLPAGPWVREAIRRLLARVGK